MSVIGVTRLRVRSVRYLPAFAVHFLRTRKQVRQAPGFQGGSVLQDRVGQRREYAVLCHIGASPDNDAIPSRVV
jgi:hypothetical protein